MATETVWVCDKCGKSGDKHKVPGTVTLLCEITELEYKHLDLCAPCLNKVTAFIHDFMNPKREYPSEEEKETTAKKKA